MSFSTKIILSDYQKADGQAAVQLQAVIDGKRAVIPLGFYVTPECFDQRRQRVTNEHPNAKDYEVEILQAIAKANTIASKFRQNGLLLTPDAFRKSYFDPTEAMDLIKFMDRELKLKEPTLSENTCKSHTTVINKLRMFMPTILFSQVDRELVQRFRNKLIKDGNGPSTIEKVIKILKQYLNEARRNGIAVRDIEIRIRTFRSNRSALSEEEVAKLDEYYHHPDCPKGHRKVLQYFLFSCYTGMRISDIKVLTWSNVGEDMLTYSPIKTKAKQGIVNVPLLDVDKKYLPNYTSEKSLVFKTLTDQANNRSLKKIAKHLAIKKNVTYHTSRHTFGSFMAEGGDVVSLQKMMGHSNIRTSMEYVHTNVKQLIEAKRARFGKDSVSRSTIKLT